MVDNEFVEYVDMDISEQIQVGFTAGNHNQRANQGTIRIVAHHAPAFGSFDNDLKCRPKLRVFKSIIVEREVSEFSIGSPEVKWSDGQSIGCYERKRLSPRIQRKIDRAIRETRRIAGGI